MKKTIFAFLALFLITASAFAQFPEAGTKSFTFGISGLSTIGLNTNVGHTGNLLYKYYTTDNLALRFSGGLAINSTGFTSDNGSGKNSVSSTVNNSYSLGFGLQRNIVNVNKFNIYAGADLALTIAYSRNSTKNVTYDSSLVGGQNGDYFETITLNPTNLKIGLYPFGGVNYFLSKNFAIGAEFSLGALYGLPYKSSTVTNQKVNGVEYLNSTTNVKNQGSSFSISTTNSVLLTLGVYF